VADEKAAEIVKAQARKIRILIADESRVARVALMGSLREHFEMREAVDGEAALQAVLMDSSIKMVIADSALPKLDGLGLLMHIRDSNIPRIREMPVVITVISEQTFDQRRAASLGVSDVIPKNTRPAELIARLEMIVRQSSERELLADSQASLGANRAIDPETQLHNLAYFDRQVEKMISYSRRNLVNVAILCISIGFSGPKAKAPDAEVEQRLIRLGRTLASTIRMEDLATRSERTEFCMATQVTGMVDVMRFATRLRKVVESLDLGTGIEVRSSIGVASLTEDLRRSAEELRATALQRAKQAKSTRSRRIMLGQSSAMTENVLGEQDDHAGMNIDMALALIRAGRSDEVLPQLSRLMAQIAPLTTLARQQEELRSLAPSPRETA
jgi:diguanylate cyclase (GGDEF)-like protein